MTVGFLTRFSRKTVRVLGVLGAATVVSAVPLTDSAAQSFPTRPIIMVVPYAAGGPTDTVARVTAQFMGKALGQTIVVENVAGAGGTLGASRVAKALPDGYSILVHHIGLAVSPAMYRKLPFDPVKDLAPLGLITEAPMTFVAKPGMAANSLQEMIAWVKANPGRVSYAHGGIGGAAHLCGMLFQKALDTELVTIAYRGTGPAMTDLMGGQVDMMCDQTTNTVSQIKGGRVKVYGVTTAERIPSLPEVPTLAQAGLPGFELSVWHGAYAPKGTPPEILAALTKALATALAEPELKQRFQDVGTDPVPVAKATPDALGGLLASEIAKWTPIIQAAGAYAD